MLRRRTPPPGRRPTAWSCQCWSQRWRRGVLKRAGVRGSMGDAGRIGSRWTKFWGVKCIGSHGGAQYLQLFVAIGFLSKASFIHRSSVFAFAHKQPWRPNLRTVKKALVEANKVLFVVLTDASVADEFAAALAHPSHSRALRIMLAWILRSAGCVYTVCSAP